MYVLNSSYPLAEGPTCGPLGAQPGRKVDHGVIHVVDVPFTKPAAAREVKELPVGYPGDADGRYIGRSASTASPRRSTTSSAATT